MKLVKLQPADVWIGMVLPFDLYDSNSIVLVRRGEVIADQEMLTRTLAGGIYALEDEVESSQNVTNSYFKRGRPYSEFAAKPASAFELVRAARSDLAALLLDRMVRPQFPRLVLDIARELQNICQRGANAAIASIIIDHAASYPIRHSVNTAILTELMLQSIERDATRRLSGITAALTMNIGMIRLQEILYYQTDPLSPEQKAAIAAHPAAGIEQLTAREVTDEIWLRAVFQHHEQVDGNGYPKRLSGVELAREAQVIAVAERYCSMSSERAYRPALTPSQVLEKLFTQSKEINHSLAGLLIREIGIYPPGSYVRLVNGELALVISRTDKPNHPLVQSLTDVQGEPSNEGSTRDTSEPAFHVVAAVSPGDVKVEHDPAYLCASPR